MSDLAKKPGVELIEHVNQSCFERKIKKIVIRIKSLDPLGAKKTFIRKTDGPYHGFG